MNLEASIVRLISESPVKRSQLLRLLREEGHQITDRIMRKAVEKMITGDGYCIQSSEAGYKLIRSKEDLDNAISYLEKKSKAIAIRKNCLLSNYNTQRATNQIPLFV